MFQVCKKYSVECTNMLKRIMSTLKDVLCAGTI